GGERQPVFERDRLALNHPLDDRVEVLHAVELAVAHRVEQGLAVGLARVDVPARARRGPQDFDGGDAPAPVGARYQTMRDDVAEGLREARAYDLLLVLRVEAEDAVNRLRGVYGVQSREDEVARLGGFERD